MRTADLELLARTPPERLAYIKTVQNAFESVLGTWRYATAAISTGRRMYETFLRHNVKSVDELERKAPGAYRREILLPNIEEGIAFAQQVSQRTRETTIAPARFEAEFATPEQRWTQDEYMFVWYCVLGPRTHAHDLPLDWALSTGGLREATRSIEIRHGIYDDPIPADAGVDEQLRAWVQRKDLHDRRICDAAGNPLEFHDLLKEAAESLSWLQQHGFDASKHARLIEPWRAIFIDAVMDPDAPQSEYVWHNGKRIRYWESRVQFQALARSGLLAPVPDEPRLAADTRQWIVAVGGSPMLSADYAHQHQRPH